MKKLALFLGLCTLSIIAPNLTQAASDCKEVEFSDGTVCVSIEKDSNTRFSLETDIVDGNSSASLQCGILLFNEQYKDVSCDGGTFYQSDYDEGLVKIYIRMNGKVPTDWDDKPNNDSIRIFPQWMYDFDNEEWMDTNYYEDDDDNDNYGDADNFYITTSPSSPDEDENIDLTIKVRDDDGDIVEDYRNTVTFKVERKSGSSWISASSSYYSIDDDEYTFTSSDDGEKTLYDYIIFKQNGDFRLTIEDEDDDNIYGTKYFYIGTNNNNYDDYDYEDADNFYISTTPSSPKKNENIDLIIKVRDNNNNIVEDYRNTVTFKVERKSGSSWVSASSSYYSIDDDEYTFTSSDDGEKTLYDYIIFKQNGDFRVTIEDEDDDDIYGTKYFYIGTTSKSNTDDLSSFYITTSPISPDTNEWVDVTVKARKSNNYTYYDYDGIIDFKVERKSGSSWISASSYYYDIDFSSYNFSSSNRGQKTFSDLVRFKQSGEYRLTIEDDDQNVSAYKDFEIDTNNSYTNGFSSSELNSLEKIYDVWQDMIDELKDDYRSLRTNTTWINKSDDLYENMKEVIDNKSNKTYNDYDDFIDAFNDWYSYTINNK